MFQIDNASAATTQPASTPPGTAGFFTDGNPATSVPATIVPAEWLNSVMMELMNVLSAAGIAPNKSAFNQIATAIRGISRQLGGSATLTDTGAVNAYAAVNPVPLTAGTLVHGVRQRVTIANTNTGASTYAPDGLPAKPVIGMNLQALAGSELHATLVADLEYIVAASLNSGNGVWLLHSCGGGAFQLPAGSYGVTPAQFDNSTNMASTAFVQRALGNYAGVNVYNANATLTAADIGKVAQFTLSANATVTMPNPASFPKGSTLTVYNASSSYTVTISGSIAGPGSESNTIIGQGVRQFYTDGGSYWICTTGVGLSLITTSGYQKFASGLIIQWGQINSPTNGATIAYPIAFPNQAFQVGGIMDMTGITSGYVYGVAGVAKASMTFQSAGTAPSNFIYRYLITGN